MNLRKILSACASLACITSVYAAPAGFFVGGMLGVTSLKGEHTYTTVDGSGVSKLNKVAPHGGLNLGYLMSMQDGKVCVGAEVYGLTGGPSVSKDLFIKGGPIEGRFNVANKGIMGASIITGMMLNPRLMGYARVGYEINSFEFKYTEMTFESPNNKTYKKKVSGLAPGGGVLFRVTSQLSVMVDATVPVLSKVTVRSKDTNGRSMEYSPAVQRVTCRVIYAF